MLVLFLWQIARALSASMALHCVAVLYSLGMSHSGLSPLCSSAHSIAPSRRSFKISSDISSCNLLVACLLQGRFFDTRWI
ncbi:hypothetical protein C8J56DRAFT_974493 [Mycena floridula]|nr:hypothetical protein C8J56DRAFT_974493 [Mycena floridula]